MIETHEIDAFKYNRVLMIAFDKPSELFDYAYHELLKVEKEMIHLIRDGMEPVTAANNIASLIGRIGLKPDTTWTEKKADELARAAGRQD